MANLEEERRFNILTGGEPGVTGGWNLAGKNMRSSPYADFEPFDDGYDDIESYRGKPAFGVEEDGQTFFEFPFVQNPTNQNMLISSVPYTGGGWMLNNGGFVNSAGEAFRQNRDGSFDYLGPYTEDRFGPLIPGGGPNIDLASHDKPQFKSVPATGPRGDTMAPDWLIDHMNRKDENLLQIQKRLRV